eukprot:8008019-Prorocentrum_lima.AAC.1
MALPTLPLSSEVQWPSRCGGMASPNALRRRVWGRVSEDGGEDVAMPSWGVHCEWGVHGLS